MMTACWGSPKEAWLAEAMGVSRLECHSRCCSWQQHLHQGQCHVQAPKDMQGQVSVTTVTSCQSTAAEHSSTQDTWNVHSTKQTAT